MIGEGGALEGARVVLREITPDDWMGVHAYAQQPEVCRFQVWGPGTPATSQAFVQEIVAAAAVRPRTRYALAITIKGDDSLRGVAEFNIRSFPFRTAEIGYVLHPNYWGRGYATEAARLLLRFGFGELGLHRIFATCDPRNVASAHVLQKIGMQHEGRMRENLLIRDGWRDSDLYAILDHEWKSRQNHTRSLT